jgi:hypothetical protein
MEKAKNGVKKQWEHDKIQALIAIAGKEIKSLEEKK